MTELGWLGTKPTNRMNSISKIMIRASRLLSLILIRKVKTVSLLASTNRKMAQVAEVAAETKN